MVDVFISYKREERGRCERIYDKLHALGLDVWFDVRLTAGKSFDREIETAVKSAKAVVVLWSPASVESEWVREEAAVGKARDVLAAIRIAPCDLPFGFGTTHVEDIHEADFAEDHPGWLKILDRVGSLTGRPDVADYAKAARATGTMMTTAAPSAQALRDKPSIAVLPFTDITGSKDQEYFCDGMVVEIVTVISRFRSLFVVDSGSSLTYRGGAQTLKQIAGELGVRYILQGSVRRSGEHVRIAAELVDAAVGEKIWAERFDGSMENVFALQDTVANAVASQIEPTIEATEVRRASARPTQDLRAYDLYLRALQRQRAFERQSFSEAVALLDQAVALDPDYALALALAGLCQARLVIYGFTDDSVQSRRVAADLIDRAVSLGGDDPQVLTWAAQAIGLLGGDIGAAEGMIERALECNPGSSYAWSAGGWVHLYAGRKEEALVRLRTALTMNPRSPDRPLTLVGIGHALLFQHRFDEAIPPLREAAQLIPGQSGGGVGLAVALAYLDRLDEAKAVLVNVRPGMKAVVSAFLVTFRDPSDRDLLRTGLAMIGVNV